MEEKQVHIKIVSIDVEVHLPADEREAGAEFEQEPFDLRNQGPFEVAFGDRGGQGKELEVVGVLGQLLHQRGVAQAR